MIVVAASWKLCARCRVLKPNGQFHAKTYGENGWPRTRQSYCKVCQRQRQRESKGYHARKPPLTPAQRVERRRAKYLAQMERIRSNPARLAEYRARVRMNARIRRDIRRGGPPKLYPQRMTWAGEPVVTPYATIAYHGRNANLVPAAPLVSYLRHTFPGWTAYEIATYVHNAVSERLVRRIMKGGQKNIEFDAVDRLVTHGLDRPDLLNALYPME